jgi:hypothetical protein
MIETSQNESVFQEVLPLPRKFIHYVVADAPVIKTGQHRRWHLIAAGREV